MVHFTVVGSGCKINVKNNFGVTPVHFAVRVKNVADVECFLKNNADANLQNPWGNTPLHISSCHGFSNISQLSIDSGGNKSLKNREGKKPLDLKPFSYFSHYPPFPGDSEEAKGNEGYAYASQKGFRHKHFFESEHKGDLWMNQPILPSLLVDKLRSGSPLKNRSELSWARKKRQIGHVSFPTLYGDLEEDKRDTGYASQKSFRHKLIVVESEDEDDALINPETVSSAITGKGNEQSST